MSDAAYEYALPRPYQLSGESGKLAWLPVILLLLLIIGAFVGVINGFVAQYMARYFTGYRLFFIIALFIECFFSICLGISCVGLGKAMHCRNTLIIEVLSFFQAVVALYFLSGVYVGETLHQQDHSELPYMKLYSNPALLYANLTYIFAASGNSLLLSSMFHMSALFFPGFFLTRSSMKDQVYCERCKAWLEQYDRPSLKFSIPASSKTLQRLDEGDLSALESVPQISVSKPPFIRVMYVLCRACRATGAYRITRVSPPLPASPSVPVEDSLTVLLEISPKVAADIERLKIAERHT